MEKPTCSRMEEGLGRRKGAFLARLLYCRCSRASSVASSASRSAGSRPVNACPEGSGSSGSCEAGAGCGGSAAWVGVVGCLHGSSARSDITPIAQGGRRSPGQDAVAWTPGRRGDDKTTTRAGDSGTRSLELGFPGDGVEGTRQHVVVPEQSDTERMGCTVTGFLGGDKIRSDPRAIPPGLQRRHCQTPQRRYSTVRY